MSDAPAPASDKLRLVLRSDAPGRAVMLLNGDDISSRCQGVTLEVYPRSRTRVVLHLLLDEVDADVTVDDVSETREADQP